MNEFLAFEANGQKNRIPAKVFTSSKNLGIIANKHAWKILETLSQTEMFPKEIARALKLPEQKVYYYINKLNKAGLIREVRKEERRGAIAKYYGITAQAIALVPGLHERLNQKNKSIWAGDDREESYWTKFFHPFIENHTLNCKIIIGSPDSHGKYKARARDSTAGMQFALLLGTLAQEIKINNIELDTNSTSLKTENAHLIVIGGLVINKIAEELNPFLPIRFTPSGAHWVIESQVSKKIYESDSVGVIEKIQHPFFKDKFVLFIAGKHNTGTLACVQALTEKINEVIQPNRFNSKVYCKVIEGIDENADGKIDRVEILE